MTAEDVKTTEDANLGTGALKAAIFEGTRPTHHLLDGLSLDARGSTDGSFSVGRTGVTPAFDAIYANLGGDNRSVFTLGTELRPWAALYTVNGVIQVSDREAKRFIQDSPLGIGFIMNLRPVAFAWKSTSTKNDMQYGFIGQEVQTALRGHSFAGLSVGGDTPYSLRYTDFIAPLVKAVQQQQAHIEKLEAEVIQMKSLLRDVLAKEG